ncbi:hypothetical protein [Desulfovibrio aminophilus]|uniref:hypothetical protein n=1 Tax=Desulfovibrio aminophilus TaxID=81425 RepID=UPI0033989D14
MISMTASWNPVNKDRANLQRFEIVGGDIPGGKTSAALGYIFVVQPSAVLQSCLVPRWRGQYFVSLKNKKK